MNKIYRFLSSIPLAIILLAVIAVLCVIATILPQNLPQTHYTEQFGSLFATIFIFLGFDRVFSSPLFFAFGIAFFINLSLCTWGRIELAFKIHKKKPSLKIWGSPILHLGLCILLIGVAFSLIGKHEIYYEIPVGETVTVAGKSGGFTLTLDDFSVDYYDDNVSPKQYRSSVTVHKPKLEPVPMEIQVNCPGKYNGVSILQQSFGWEMLVTLSTGHDSRQLSIKDEDWIILEEKPNGNTTLGIAFYPDYDEEEGIAQLKSYRDENPHLIWVLQEGNTSLALDTLAPGESSHIHGALHITFDGYRFYSGLQMKYDTGIPLIFTGFFLFCLGLIMLYILKTNHTYIQSEKNKTN